jgi:uncharacterized membrane protein
LTSLHVSGSMLLAADRGSGISLAWAVLLLLLAALIYAGLMVWRRAQGHTVVRNPTALAFAVPVLALIGLGVALYLAYIELTETTAVCGPVGDCNAVQSSPYAKLFGLPVGVVGVIGYMFILVSFSWGRRRSAAGASQMPLLVFGGALASVLFSMYLTCIEIFVIQAVCIWCLGSAVLAALLLVLSADPLTQSAYFSDD